MISLIPVLLLLVASLLPPSVCPSDHGCLRGQDGWVYEFTRRDVEWFTRAMECETGTHIPGPEADATAWTLVQRFYQLRGSFSSLAGFLQAYCQPINRSFGPFGHRETKRGIKDRVYWCRNASLSSFPERGKWFVRRFLQGEVPNRVPGYVHFLTASYRSWKCPQCRDEYQVHPYSGGSTNIYYRTRETRDWTPDHITVIPPVRRPSVLDSLLPDWTRTKIWHRFAIYAR